jgi:hypothetical protein
MISEIMYYWELIAPTLVGKYDSLSTCPVTVVFLQTLFGNDDDYMGHASEGGKDITYEAPGFASWYSEYGTDVLAKKELEFFDDSEFLRTWSKKDGWLDKWQKDSVAYGKKFKEVCAGRRFFFYKEGMHRTCATGDHRR